MFPLEPLILWPPIELRENYRVIMKASPGGSYDEQSDLMVETPSFSKLCLKLITFTLTFESHFLRVLHKESQKTRQLNSLLQYFRPSLYSETPA